MVDAKLQGRQPVGGEGGWQPDASQRALPARSSPLMCDAARGGVWDDSRGSLRDGAPVGMQDDARGRVRGGAQPDIRLASRPGALLQPAPQLSDPSQSPCLAASGGSPHSASQPVPHPALRPAPQPDPQPSPQLLRRCLELYLATCRGERRLDEKTLKAYRCDITQFLAWIEEAGLPFERESIRAYVVRLNEKRTASTVMRKVASIRAWAGWMKRERLMPANPFDDLEIRMRRPEILPRVVRSADLRLLLTNERETPPQTQEGSVTRDMIAVRDRAVLELLVATGMRVSELCALNVESIDLFSDQVRIFGKGSKERVVVLGSQKTLAVIERYMDLRLQRACAWSCAPTAALFLNRSNKRLTDQAVRKMIVRRAKEAGITRHITP